MKNHAALLSPPPESPLPWSERLRRSKALIPALAVLGVTTLALAASLVAHRADAHLAAAGMAGPPAAQSAAAQPVAPQGVVKAPPAAAVRPVQSSQQVAAACTNCGTVEAVTAVQRANAPSGVGAVAGGVIGGLLGNQIGGGSGRTAMTVLGAVGGGYAGHQVEKNVNKRTVYRIHVRMSDGRLRTLEQATAVATGSQVVVENGAVRLAGQPAG